MALSRVTVWVAGQVLTAAALNAEFNNIINNPLTLISPTTGNINFGNNQALSFNLEKLAAVPAAGSTGRIWFRTDLNQVQVDDGTIIRTLPTVAATLSTVGGGLVVSASSADGSFKVLPIGTTGQVLTVTSSLGIIAWSGALPSTTNLLKTSEGGTGQDFSTANPGGIIVVASSGNGVFKILNIGTTAQVLTVTSSNGILGYATPSAASGGGSGTVTSSSVTLKEDFHNIQASAIGSTAAYSWASELLWANPETGSIADVFSSAGGNLIIVSTQGVRGGVFISTGIASASRLTFLSTWNPNLTMLVGMASTSTGGYIWGFLSTALFATNPTNGVFFRSSNGNGGTIQAVGIVNSVESLIATTLVQSSNGAKGTYQINISSSGTLATMITNGVTAGTFTSSQFPVTTTALAMGFHTDGVAALAKVMIVDAVQITHDRIPVASTA
jgi:hypothetical protein